MGYNNIRTSRKNNKMIWINRDYKDLQKKFFIEAIGVADGKKKDY